MDSIGRASKLASNADFSLATAAKTLLHEHRNQLRTSNVGYSGYPNNHGAFAMQKEPRTPTSVQMMIHCGMGAILGVLLGLGLIVTDKNIFQFIVSSSSPLMNIAVFTGFFSFVVGTGATISGFFFTVIELNALKAKQQTKRLNQWRGPDNVE